MINYTSKPKNKRFKKAMIFFVCAIVFIFAAVSVVGIIASSDSEKRRAISGAIEENTRLKSETELRSNEIAELNKLIEELEAELKNRPSPSPTPFKIENKSDEGSSEKEKTSPRDISKKENTDG